MGRENSTRYPPPLIRLISLQINFFWDKPVHLLTPDSGANVGHFAGRPATIRLKSHSAKRVDHCMHHFTVILLLIALGGCASQPILRKDGTSSVRPFNASNLAKSDADMMAELSQRESLNGLRLLSEKLYRRNPRELQKSGHDSVTTASAAIFQQIPKWLESPSSQPDWQTSFVLAFQANHDGDRVHAFMSGLVAMLMAAYDFKSEFFITDSLSAQKLYNCARNIEIAVWKLSNAKQPNGLSILVSNSMDGEVANLSFEREFGKLIARQDMLALFIEDKSNRSISRVFQNVATVVFLPI